MTGDTRCLCPWERVEQCPLYVASHNTDGLGCIDDMALPCLVKRGAAKYAVMTRQLGSLPLEYLKTEGQC